MQANSINEVIQALDLIIQDSIQRKSRMGYFACLYRKMTLAVKEGIRNGAFEDGPRMERLDVIFANRYLDAYNCLQNRTAPTFSWKRAFDATAQPYTVIQHLLLGMNAHINLDLGIAAALAGKGRDIHLLKNDFNRINDVIGSLINSVQSDLEDICWPMRMVRYVDNSSKDAVINFSIKIARDTAWANAVALSLQQEPGWPQYYTALDNKIALVAQNIVTPKLSQSILLRTVQLFEPRDVARIIRHLRD